MRMFVFLAMQICVTSWASYYKLSDHCKKPLVQGETIMGKEVEVSEDRHIMLLDAEGAPLECGKATIQPGKTIQASLSNPSEPAQYSEVRLLVVTCFAIFLLLSPALPSAHFRIVWGGRIIFRQYAKAVKGVPGPAHYRYSNPIIIIIIMLVVHYSEHAIICRPMESWD